MVFNTKNPRIVHFGDCVLDLDTAELRRNGTKATLQDQPFQILIALLETPGHLVRREELIKKLWPDGTFVDFDQSLNKAMARLRETLGDSSENPRFVETLPRRGYRFIGIIEFEPDKVNSTAPPPTAELQLANNSRSSSRLRRILFPAVVGVVLSLAIALGWWVRRRALGHDDSHSPVIRSLAVLPLENLSGDVSQEYFADGMTDELITDLAMLSHARVISRTSAMQYRGTHKSVPLIARELNVDAIIEGSVMRSGDRVRIRVQLLDAHEDRHLWAGAYDCDVKDLLQAQASAAREIAGELKLQLSPQETLARKIAVLPEAHELYLKGRFFWNKRDEESLNKAIGYFRQAIAADPAYAEAYAGIADCYIILFGYAPVLPKGALENAKLAAEKALYLDDSLAEAHTSLAILMPYFGWNWDESKKQYQRALALNPNYATAHHWYGDTYLAQMGSLTEAVEEIRKAQQLDPLSPIIATDLGKNLILARNYDDAIIELRRALELDQHFGPAHFWLYYAYIETANFVDARDELDKTEPFIGHPRYLAERTFLLARSGNRHEAHKLLRQVLKISENVYVHPGAMTYVYCALGDKDNAFRWLEKAYAEHNSFVSSVKIMPALDPLRTDPRYNDFVRRVGLPL
jgi:TolB-like protein/DNA-binding winged helix-turn-helix (wHTH) protein/Tfp pilus assembly protein PilF